MATVPRDTRGYLQRYGVSRTLSNKAYPSSGRWLVPRMIPFVSGAKLGRHIADTQGHGVGQTGPLDAGGQGLMRRDPLACHDKVENGQGAALPCRVPRIDSVTSTLPNVRCPMSYVPGRDVRRNGFAPEQQGVPAPIRAGTWVRTSGFRRRRGSKHDPACRSARRIPAGPCGSTPCG